MGVHPWVILTAKGTTNQARRRMTVHKLDPMGLTLPTPGNKTAHDEVARTGAILAGRFEILELLGVGGMGSVYRARDVTLDETVALKMIARSIAREPGMLERFRREVRLARRVTHPNVARCFDIGQHDDDCFFTMELIEGESLRARLDREGRVTAAAAIVIATEVCAGLGAAHRASVVHRDLKPDNVMLGAEGRVVLTDFGIASARLLADRGQRTVGTLVGTPEYISPEQVQGERDLDGRADIYSLGVMLFELVTGRVPWVGPTPLAVVVARLGADPPDPRQLVELDDQLAAIIMRCMARRREDRFASVDDVARALYEVYVPGSGEQLGRSFSPPADVDVDQYEGLEKPSVGAMGARKERAGPRFVGRRRRALAVGRRRARRSGRASVAERNHRARGRQCPCAKAGTTPPAAPLRHACRESDQRTADRGHEGRDRRA